MKPSNLYIGLMSGTSLDGVDVVLADFAEQPKALAHEFSPFPELLRAQLRDLMVSGADEIERMGDASVALADFYALMVNDCLRKAAVPRSQVRALGVHGQTIRHRPEGGFTVQLNHPARVAEKTGICVVADFRSRDIAAGGQGAPLVPAFHAEVFADPTQWRAVINLGGIANVTLLPPKNASNDPVCGWDTGPANTLIDQWCERHTGAAFDRFGAWAATGTVQVDLLNRLLSEPYFSLPPPKCTGRELFNLSWLDQRLAGGEAAPDVQATLVELTARSVADSIRSRFQGRLDGVYLCGGGALNTTLVGSLDRALEIPTQSTATLGLPVDQVEAMAFAWLAKQCIDGQPGNLPAVTGAGGLRVLGAIYPA